MRSIALFVVVMVAGARAAAAQTPATEAAMQAAAVLRTPPAVAQVPAADRVTPAGELPAPREFSSRTPGVTLMIVGGASLLAGILVGGDGGLVLILAGIGVGTYGLILYTR